MWKLMVGQKEERTWGEPAELADRQIRSTTDKKAYPEGRYVAPRAEVKTLDVLSKGKKLRAIGTSVGVWSGLALCVYAGGHMDSAGAALAIFGLVGGGR